MPDASSYPPRLRFFDDLRRIREHRGVALETLHEETRIPLNVLYEFEATGLAENPMFNQVYLRSLVRAYAAYVDVPVNRVLEALDEALRDVYDGRLAVEFLGATPSAPPAPPEVPPAVEGSSASQDAAGASTPSPKPAPPLDEAKAPLNEYVQGTSRQKGAHPLLTTAEISWEKRGAGPGRRGAQPVDVKKRASHMQWVLIVGTVLLFAAAIWGVLALLEQPASVPSRQAAALDTTTVDSASVDRGTEALTPRPRVVLGDTLDVVIMAVERVERILIKRDEDARRPYWIEEGVAKAFPSLERIVLQDRLDKIRLLLKGYEYPTTRRDEQGRVVITRDAAQAFLDSVAVPPVFLSTAPDTIPLVLIRAQ